MQWARAFQSNNSQQNRRFIFTARHSPIASSLFFWQRKTCRNSLKTKNTKTEFRHWQARAYVNRFFFFLLLSSLSFYFITYTDHIVFCFHARNFPRKRIVLIVRLKDFAVNRLSSLSAAVGAERATASWCVCKGIRYLCVQFGMRRNESHNVWALIKQHSAESIAGVWTKFVPFETHSVSKLKIISWWNSIRQWTKWCEFD